MGYEKDQMPLPQKGDLSIVLDGNGNPVLIIETVSVVILPFNEVSEQFAFEEGEGDRSIAYWRTARSGLWRESESLGGFRRDKPTPLNQRMPYSLRWVGLTSAYGRGLTRNCKNRWRTFAL